MKTNELKKGDRVLLECGWYATIADNKKGDTRLAEVEGNFTELGSIYSHDIVLHIGNRGQETKIEYTKNQEKLRQIVEATFG